MGFSLPSGLFLPNKQPFSSHFKIPPPTYNWSNKYVYLNFVKNPQPYPLLPHSTLTTFLLSRKQTDILKKITYIYTRQTGLFYPERRADFFF